MAMIRALSSSIYRFVTIVTDNGIIVPADYPYISNGLIFFDSCGFEG